MQAYQTFISLSYGNDCHLQLTDAERVVGAECEAVRTGALAAAHQVAAGAGRRAEAGGLAALVHVAARAAVGGQREALGTLAGERSGRVATAAVATHVQPHAALVNV